MAYYEKLPIYKQSLDLTVWIEKTVRNFPQYHKYTIGSDLRNKSREITILVGRANVGKDRRELLLKVRDKLEELKLLIRICKELKVFKSFKSYEFAVRPNWIALLPLDSLVHLTGRESNRAGRWLRLPGRMKGG